MKGEKFDLNEALEKFIDYNNNHEHSTVKMSPNDAHKEENEKEVRLQYIIKYKLKHDDTVKYAIYNLVRIYKCKDTFTKKSGSRFTEEVFKVREVQETKPHTYLLKNLNGEEIKGSCYSFELISVANKNWLILFIFVNFDYVNKNEKKFAINLSIINNIINYYSILTCICILVLMLKIIQMFLILYFLQVQLLVKIVNLLIVNFRKTMFKENCKFINCKFDKNCKFTKNCQFVHCMFNDILVSNFIY